MRTFAGFAVVSLVVLAAAAPVSAAVDFRRFETERFQEQVVDVAAAREAPVVLVVTQPDWCPPCIELDRLWLKNPDETAVRDLLGDAVVAEVRGYDEDGARLLADQGVRFAGTPTVVVLRDVRAGEPLGRATLVGTIVGAPEDFPERLRDLLEGGEESPAIASRAAAGDVEDPMRLAERLLDEADRRVERGEAEEAQAAIDRARRLLPGADPEAEALLERADWTEVRVAQSVAKDHEAALALIDRFETQHPDSDTDTAYARAWSLARVGRVDEALALAADEWLGDDDELSRFAYFAFRTEAPLLLRRAEAELREALAERPEDAGSLSGALARVLRRQGRLQESAALFERARALAANEAARRTADAQLEHVRREIEAAYQPPERKALSMQFVGYEPGGPFGPGFTFALFVLPVAILMLAGFLVLIGVGAPRMAAADPSESAPDPAAS